MNSDGGSVSLEQPALVNSAGERRDRIIYKVVLTGGKLLARAATIDVRAPLSNIIFMLPRCTDLVSRSQTHTPAELTGKLLYIELYQRLI